MGLNKAAADQESRKIRDNSGAIWKEIQTSDAIFYALFLWKFIYRNLIEKPCIFSLCRKN